MHSAVKLFSALLLLSLFVNLSLEIIFNNDDEFESFQRTVERDGISRKELKNRGVIHYEEDDDDEFPDRHHGVEYITCRMDRGHNYPTVRRCEKRRAKSQPACTLEFDVRTQHFSFGCVQTGLYYTDCNVDCDVAFMGFPDYHAQPHQQQWKPAGVCCCTRNNCTDPFPKIIAEAFGRVGLTPYDLDETKLVAPENRQRQRKHFG